jgi:hypothetical protein
MLLGMGVRWESRRMSLLRYGDKRANGREAVMLLGGVAWLRRRKRNRKGRCPMTRQTCINKHNEQGDFAHQLCINNIGSHQAIFPQAKTSSEHTRAEIRTLTDTGAAIC